MNNETLVPFRATHPGELLKDELKERDMSQKQLAEATGIKASVISGTITICMDPAKMKKAEAVVSNTP